MNELGVIYLTANQISEKFSKVTRQHFVEAVNKANVSTDNIIIMAKSNVPDTVVQVNITPEERSHVGIYRDALRGAKELKTQYIAIAEDDVLYSPDHFKKRPTRDDVFAYNIACWSIYTWSDPAIFSYTGRRNFGQLICNRELFIEAMEERFKKFKDDSEIDNANWAEPGKYEVHLGVTVRKTELFYTDPANIMFTHPKGLSFNTLGMRKRLAPIRALEIPYWGRAKDIAELYE